MKHVVRNRTKMLRKRMFNTALLLIFSVIAISTYYTANYSKAKDIVEVSVNIKNSLIEEEITNYIVNASEGSDGESFYIKLPEYINNKKVIKYSYYLGEKASVKTEVIKEKDKVENIEEDIVQDNEVDNTINVVQEEETSADSQLRQENLVEEDAKKEEVIEENVIIEDDATSTETLETDINEIGPNDVLPESKIYLTTTEIEKEELTIVAHYDTKQIGEETYYQQLLTRQEEKSKITVTGYMPSGAKLDITEVDLKETQKTIREQTQTPVILSVAYDIKIQVGEVIYEPYEVDESVNVKIEKEELQNKETNVWHIKDNSQVEEIKDKEKIEDAITFTTDGFSVYALEDVEATALAVDGMADSVLTIDDTKSDKDYWIGRNYTDDKNGSEANRGTNQQIYTSFAEVTINYYGYANNETDPEMIGYISLEERDNVVTHKRIVPIQSGNVSIELMDNPFMDKPTGYGFGGWTSTSGTITKDANTNAQTISLAGSASMTLDIYTNWTQATVVYVNPDEGNDTANDGLTADTPFASWGAAFKHLYNNSNNRNDRENNIIVLTGDINSGINYTTPVTEETITYADVTYNPSTSFTSGGTYILATNTGAGANAITANGTAVTNTVLQDDEAPPETAQWIITQSGNGYTIRNVGTGNYLAYSNYQLRLQTGSVTWTHNNRRFYYNNRYIRYNRGWTTSNRSNQGQQFYFLTYDLENVREETITVKGEIEANDYYTSSTNVAVTVTSLYNHTDYRANAVMDLTGTYKDITLYNDFQIDYVDINGTGYRSDTNGTSAGSPYLYGNGNNTRIGRGMYPMSNTDNTAATFRTVYGGATSGSVGSTSNSNNAYRLVVETGKYSQIQGFHGSGSNNYYGTVYMTLGNDVDRAKGINDQMHNYNRCTINRGSGVNGHSDVNTPAFIINVKSGTFGYDYIYDNPTNDNIAYAGIYVGGHGTSASSSVRDISDRYCIVEGGDVANIIGGLKITSGSNVDTRIYVKGGYVRNIVGGAGYSTTYEDRIIQVTGGTIRYSVSGGSNGVYATTEGSDGKILNCNTLVYVGGEAKIGEEATLGTTLYDVAAGSVLGAGNGNDDVDNSGQVNNSHIIIDGNAHIYNSVYGGGNFGIVGPPDATSATAKIEILGGTIDGNVYGGANQNHIYGQTLINVKGGQVKGAVYGGSNQKGTVYTTSTINVTGGTLGVNTNTTDNPALFGGGYGQNTQITGNAIVNILDTDKDVQIYGSAYGGSSQGKMNSNVTVNIQDLPTVVNKISIAGYVFAGGKGTSGIAATIAGNATMNVDGCELPDASVFGGNDINGTTSGDITVNVGRNYNSALLAAYGGGNKADILTSAPSVKVYLLTKADVTKAFNGGKAADLLSSGASDTSRAIYLQGGHADNIFGGSDSSGTVTSSHVYIQSGTADNVYGGNNEDGQTTASYVYITGGTSKNVYGGGYQATTPATNVSLTGGTVTNGFGGGNAANVTNSSIILAGSTATNIYGGSNQQGTVTKSYVAINSGTVTDVFGGNNAGGNTIDTEVIVNSTAVNIYGGGNEAITTNDTSVTLTNATITGSAFGGGNGTAAVVLGDSLIISEGTTNIAGDLFGGGNAAANGTTDAPATTKVHITGGTIGGDVYGAANTSVVNGQTEVKVGTIPVNNNSLAQGNIYITGTVFGGGKSNLAGSEDYDFNFVSVTGDVHIDINASGYDNGTYTFSIGQSVFGSGNAAKIDGNGYVTISNYGTGTNLKQNVSIQRATEVTLDKCGLYLSGTTDRTNEISSALYTFNRIKNLIIKNNTTLYLESGANLLEKLTSVDSSGNKATVTIGENGVTNRNVDNRIYLFQGKNLELRTEDGAHGEVNGMTYVGLYRGTITRVTGIYSPDYTDGEEIPETEENFARNSFVQGKHYESHNIEVDGFYTNYNESGIINVAYIIPTPEQGAYYQWIVGTPTDDIYYDNIELIATKYATTSTYVLELTGLNKPNMTLEVVGMDSSDIKDAVELTNQSNIPNIEMDPDKANNRFSLTMTAGNTGWQTKGTSEFFRTPGQTEEQDPEGTLRYLSENSTATPSFSLYMASSKNISTTEKLGTITLQLKASYYEPEKDEIIMRNVYVVLTLSTNNTIKLANDYYEGAITPGKQYDMFPTTNTNITSNSSLSTYYSLYLGSYSTDENYYYEADSETGMVGYYHCLVSSCVLPEKTKITMIDSSTTPVQYYYYIVSAADVTAGKKEFKFTEFTNMGSTEEKYDSDLSYYNEELDIVLEEYIFQVDFADITLANSLEQQKLTVELRDQWDDSMKLNVNTDQYPMMYNLYSDKEATKSVDVEANKTYIYMGNSFKVDLSTEYKFQTENSETVFDTTHFDDQLGVKITVLDGSTPLTASQLTGIYLEHGGSRYFARYDGSYRLKLADAVSNILTELQFYTENGNLDTATYTFKFETFGSIDGVYFSSAIATDSINMQVINTDYGLKAELDDNSVLIDKTTGLTKNNNNQLDFTIGYSSEFENAKIHVSLLRRDYSSIYASTYSLVNLTDYITNTLTGTSMTNEYLVVENPQATQTFSLKLGTNLVSGTYKIVFSLYDGDNYIGNVEKMVIIK